ncbi:MAG: RNA polymerase sigma factor [Phycisphaerales bacterium]|nr:RNA polymerase sigma factor [Phycisphaerales bacterium]
MTFEEIFIAHKDKVYTLCYRYLQQEQEAEDAVQDIFIKIFKKKDSFRAEAQMSTWIYRIGMNHCLDILKSKRRKQEFYRLVSHLPFMESKMEASRTENKLEDKESFERIQKCILQLPENQLSVLVLNKLEGLRIEEVAKIMNMSYKAVESLLQRAKNNLKKQLNNASKD